MGLLSLFIILAISPSFSQVCSSRIFAREVNFGNNLSTNEVWKIKQDKTGYLWICTTDGLARYDGHNVINLRNEYSSPYLFPGDSGCTDRDPDGIVQTGYYEQADGSYSPGMDTRGGVDDWNGTYTGYYMRKFIDPAVDHQFEYQNYPWREMRYTEIILDYAECCIELGQDGEAREYINMIRKRAGMPDITESGNDLKERYRHERRIEMAWEQQRYFDIRRWLIGDKAMTDAKGVNIQYPYGSSKPNYTIQTIEERSWDNKSYLMPIYLNEIQKNELLIQNPGY